MLKKIIDKRNYIILAIIILLSIFIFFGNKPNIYVKSFYYFNETITFEIYTKNIKDVSKNIDMIYKKYDKIYKNPNYNTDKDLIDLLKYGKSLYNETNGLIDITSAELLKKISKGETFNFKSSIDKINFNKKETLKNINIDSIIGAYATKEVQKYLEGEKIDKYIINEDGNIITGKGIKGKYKISIMDIDDKIIDIVFLENMSMATKGNVNDFKPYMINPITSTKNQENKIVVVISKDINTANMLANTLYLMDAESGYEFIKKYDAEALWYINNSTKVTSGFKSYLENSKNL